MSHDASGAAGAERASREVEAPSSPEHVVRAFLVVSVPLVPMGGEKP